MTVASGFHVVMQIPFGVRVHQVYASRDWVTWWPAWRPPWGSGPGLAAAAGAAAAG